MLHLSVDEYHMRSVWWPYGGSFPSNASAFDVQLRSRRLKGIFRSRYTILDRPIEGLDGASRLARPLLDPELDTTNRRSAFVNQLGVVRSQIFLDLPAKYIFECALDWMFAH